MGLLKLLRRASAPVLETRSTIDVKSIDESFQLLKATTVEVSQAAVSAAKALQERLDNSESRFSWTIDSIEDFVLIKDGEGRWKTLNKFGQRLLSITQADYFDLTDDQISKRFPHLKETLEYCTYTDLKAWSSGVSSRSEEKVPHEGSYRYLDMIKTPTYNDDGTKKELVIVGRDVTELYENERREKACFQALNSASDAIAIIDQKARLFFCNDQFVNIFDFTNYQEIVGKTLNTILPNLPLYDEMWDTVQQNRTWSIQCPHSSLKHGEEVTSCTHSPHSCDLINCPIRRMQLTILPMMNGQPKPIYYICTFKSSCSVE